LFVLYLLKTQNTREISEKFARFALAKYLDTDGDKLNIVRNQYGKPYLVNYPNVYFNISHTRGAIACAVSDNPVGVDIESIRKINLRVVSYFFSQQEKDYILADPKNIDLRFTEVWTKKEAYLKFIGKGISVPIEVFNVFKVLDTNIMINCILLDKYIISTCFSRSRN
jgi:4'-phosphopantetheinyl transferase